MALAIDATSSGINTTNQTAGGTTTVSHTCTGSNLVLIVSISTWNNGGTGMGCSGVTYNGTAMTMLGNSAVSGQFYTEQWRLVAPSAGTHNIIATVSGKTDKLGLAGISFTGADQTTGVDVSTGTTGTVATVTASLTTTSASEYLVDVVNHLSANTPTSHSGTTIMSDATNGVDTSSQYAAAVSSGTNSMNYVYPDPGDAWAYSVLAVMAGTTSAASSSTALMMGV